MVAMAALATGVGACTPPAEVSQSAVSPSTGPQYLGVETELLDNDLVNLRVRMRQPGAEQDVSTYLECAVAEYTLIRGFGFARHVRTTVLDRGGIWTGDAVYTVSEAIPRGTRTIDAEVVAANCKEMGIPTV